VILCLDNDLRPAAAAGLHTVLVKRAHQYVTYEHGTADLELDSLTELPAAHKKLTVD
jgi:FMN phosphatase YigB (HAD superfamily)